MGEIDPRIVFSPSQYRKALFGGQLYGGSGYIDLGSPWHLTLEWSSDPLAESSAGRIGVVTAMPRPKATEEATSLQALGRLFVSLDKFMMRFWIMKTQ
jgi:hypothetical protein